MRKNKYKNTILDDLGNIIGEEGIKTDVAMTIKPMAIPVIIISVMVAVVAGILIAGMIQKALKK